MAIVAHTPYTGTVDCARTNEYITDGHGLPPVDRTNRYISDGHGGHAICEGYNCPADPVLATEYMETVRLNYERQHPPGEGRTKGNVTHEQIYISPTADDNVPVEERMQMTRELIERTELRHFPSIFVPHDNTPDKHCHISCCPYSIPDQDGHTHKLCLNNAMLNDLRREMDRICVEHGYSIVENPELWADKEYRDWFFKIKEEGVVKIHPPKDQDMASFKKDRKRARTYSASKQSQALHEKKKAELYEDLTRGYNKKSAHLFYIAPSFYNAANPANEICIRRKGTDGKEMGDMELTASSLFAWAYNCEKIMQKNNIPGSGGLQRKMQALTNKAFQAKNLMAELDICTHAELIRHIKEVGCDIAELKQDIKRQGTIMERMEELMENIDRWENGKDPEAYAYLKSHRCGSPEEIADAKKRNARAVDRKAANEALLQERSTEYRHLKEAERVLHPASSEELWNEYLVQMFGKEAEKKMGYLSPDKMEQQLHQMGKVAGLAPEEIDKLIHRAKSTAAGTTWVEYHAFMQATFTRDNTGAVTAIYADIKESYADIRRLRKMARSVPVLGPVGFLLALIVGLYAGFRIAAKEREIEQLKWDAEMQKEYARETRRERQQALKNAKAEFDAETENASEAEVEAARIRFYEKAAEITGRIDILMEIGDMKKAGLDGQIQNAVGKKMEQVINSSRSRHVPENDRR